MMSGVLFRNLPRKHRQKGRPFPGGDGSHVYVDEQVRLEGVGVTPDVEVPFPIEYAQGVDPQKEKAIATALEQLNAPVSQDAQN